MEIIGYLASVVMGAIVGLTGGGGAILTVPIFVFAFGISATVATGYSLFVVGITALFGSVISFRKREVNFKAVLSFSIPSVIGVSLARNLILPKIPDAFVPFAGFTVTKESLLMSLFACLMLGASASMIKGRKSKPVASKQSRTQLLLLTAAGLTVGLIAGLVGAGGGFLIVPALVVGTKIPMRVAVGTSLTIMAIQSLLGFASDVWRGANIDWLFLVSFAGTATIGVVIGSMVSHRINEKQLKTSFGWFVLFMGVSILVQQISKIFY